MVNNANRNVGGTALGAAESNKSALLLSPSKGGSSGKVLDLICSYYDG